MLKPVLLKSLLLTFALMFSTVSSVSFAANAEKYADIQITVNVNTASAQELSDLLNGVGLKKAQAIVDYRDKNGKFSRLDQLTQVKGIGKKTVEKNAKRILF